ncbi:MaoC family dehydratase [Mangrovivirga sp. M17]|uniref:MaoC family dehydratase n=1 Tax=Mangrovivirga halotolerans TaxID=2993936 RepID=A0ABT3RMN5_9BACT|nr:MaoC family dehydratase [Mangrovivirga halotolerans]MCX2743014.1 MaoC family dehydratase [Mangrovivirga halotolerans]
MAKVIIESFKEFEEYVGKEIGVSEYIQITQDQINKFADATLDHQWIHLDEERAKTESPFKSTVAHGFLTLSLVPHLWHQIADIRNIKMLVNYGIEKFRFGAPVLSDDEVRLRVKLRAITDLRGISKTEMDIKMEIKDNPKPAFTGTLVFLYHFK